MSQKENNYLGGLLISLKKIKRNIYRRDQGDDKVHKKNGL